MGAPQAGKIGVSPQVTERQHMESNKQALLEYIKSIGLSVEDALQCLVEELNSQVALVVCF